MSPDRPAASMGGVLAVVVNFNAATHLSACVASLVEAAVSDIVVVDNASTDDSRAQLEASHPAARWIDSGANLGYGMAANLGVLGSPAWAVLVCNPDVVLEPGAVAALAARLAAEPDVGIVGPRIRNADGTVYPSARTFPDLVDAIGHGLLGLLDADNRFTRRYRLLDWDHDDPRRVDWVSGACMLVRREAWDAVGGFDPAYFMYLEDVDLCWRATNAGWESAYEPAAEVTHVQGVSAQHHPYRMLAAHHRSMWRFARRSTPGWRRLLLPVVALGLVGRLGAASLRERVGVQPARVPARSDRRP